MSSKYFVDTNILIYAHDRLAGEKYLRARQVVDHLWDTGEGVLSTQVLQELCINLRRKLARPLSLSEVSRVVRDYLEWDVVVNKPESILDALEIQERHKISFWDALILHAAELSGASVLYSEDLTADRTYGRVRVVNPFAS
jgi:predicted nucleic acid-binding protein